MIYTDAENAPEPIRHLHKIEKIPKTGTSLRKKQRNTNKNENFLGKHLAKIPESLYYIV